MSPPPKTSVFSETPMTPNQVANNLRDELRRLKRRKQIPSTSTSSSNGNRSPEPMPMDDLSALRAAFNPPSPSKDSSSSSSSSSSKPIFTLKQMTMICERMCDERTSQIREEYDKILQQKLAEQYDAFVKFIDHHIQQRFNGSQLPSYLS